MLERDKELAEYLVNRCRVCKNYLICRDNTSEIPDCACFEQLAKEAK